MLEYERIDLNKIDGLRECIYDHYKYFLHINFRLASKVSNCCHDLMRKPMSFNDVVIVSIQGNVYRIHLSYMSKDEAINLSRNADLTEKSEAF